ncbi:hypothetical protein HPP92_002856 [Vanilla planifolia]|uniref:Uncharacterized protein n=1 Tax=Vanilla planifolia TaxID=51239 RepID=A0A835S0P1_VANPL|nr:hypothetical protein HPP92_002856 [Vanilla planifolia]
MPLVCLEMTLALRMTREVRRPTLRDVRKKIHARELMKMGKAHLFARANAAKLHSFFPAGLRSTVSSLSLFGELGIDGNGKEITTFTLGGYEKLRSNE